MNTDHIFQIGHEHTVCQDYALSGITKDGTAYAIVADGCSASKDVDVGARILALSARGLIGGSHLPYENFGIDVINHASMLFDLYPSGLINEHFLDATLLVAVVKDGMMTCYIYGDGVFILKGKEHTRTVHVELSHNAPPYLSYDLDLKRKEQYILWPGIKWVTDSDNEFPTSMKPFAPVVIQSPVSEGDIVSVCSDGICSFKKSDNEPIKWNDLVPEFVGYKNFGGVFVTRRMSAFKRKCLTDGIIHSDDISISTIVV